MNRRIVIPAFITGLALCLTIAAFPVQGAPGSVVAATNTGTPDPCNPKPPVPGVVNSSQPLFVNTRAEQGAPEVLVILYGDQVNVIGKTANQFWVEVQTNSGLIGWAESPYVSVDPVQFSKVPVVDGTVEVVQAVATEAPTGAATEAATEAGPKCPTITGIVSAASWALTVKPDLKSDAEGVSVRQDEVVTVLAANGPATWFKVKTKAGDVGWIFNAYLIIDPGKRSSVPKDYSTVEIIPTPSS